MWRKIRGLRRRAIKDVAQDPGLTPRAIHLSPPPGAFLLSCFRVSRGLRPGLIVCRRSAAPSRSQIGAPEARHMISLGREPQEWMDKKISSPGGATDSVLTANPHDPFQSPIAVILAAGSRSRQR